MQNRSENMGRGSQEREGEVIDLDAVRQVRESADQALEQHRAAVERDLILHEALFGAVHKAAIEVALGDSEEKPAETQHVADMWAARLQQHMESPEHRAAA